MSDAELMIKLLATERATAEVMDTSVFFKGSEQERGKWYDGAAQEMGQMLEQKVWTEIPEDKIRQTLGLKEGEVTSKNTPNAIGHHKETGS